MPQPEFLDRNIIDCKTCMKYLPCLDGLALFTLEPIRFDLRPLHSDTYGSSGGDLILCFLRGVHSLNNWLCPEVLSRASGLQKQILVFLLSRGDGGVGMLDARGFESGTVNAHSGNVGGGG